MMGFNIVECCRINGNFISCVLFAFKRDSFACKKCCICIDALNQRVKMAMHRFYNTKEYQEENGDKGLYDETTRFLPEKQLGFMGGCHPTSGREYVRTIHTVLFTLHPHLLTLQRRKVKFIPPLFSSSLGKGVQQSLLSSP